MAPSHYPRKVLLFSSHSSLFLSVPLHFRYHSTSPASRVSIDGGKELDRLQHGIAEVSSTVNGTRGTRRMHFGVLSAAVLATLSSPFTQVASCEQAEKTGLSPQEFKRFKLKEMTELSHNTRVFRFELPSDTSLGLTVASCLVTRYQLPSEGNEPKFVIRPYTPISPPDAKGHFDLLVKVYPNSKMSAHFFSLSPGDELEMKGPIPKLSYEPNMKKRIGMIAGGTGITPMLQVIDAVLTNPEDDTQITVVFANVSPSDILLKSKLDELQSSHANFKVFYVVDSVSGSESGTWKASVGYVNSSHLRKALPEPSDEHLILVCGPPGMMRHISGDKAKDKSQGELSGLLKDLGYKSNQVYKF